MPTLPLTVPRSLADAHGLDPAGDGWVLLPKHAVATPAGDTYTLSTVWRYWRGSGDPTSAAHCNLNYQVITRHDPDGTPVATALYGHPRPDGTPSAIPYANSETLALLPDGTVAASGHPGSTHLFPPDLSRVLATWQTPHDRQYEQDEQQPEQDGGDLFASSIAVTPSGRLLCATSEYGLANWADAHLNVVALSESGSALAPGSKATLRALTALETRADRQTDAHRQPHVVHDGAPLWRDNRPSPSLIDLLSELTGTSGTLGGHQDGTMTRPSALADDLFVVPVFGRTYRSSNRGQQFSFALVDDQGGLRGRLEGLDLREDSPFTGFDFTVVADPYRGRAFHLNRYGFYAWTADGKPRSRISTADKPFKSLVHFALLECTPAGEVLLVHRKQHLLLRVPVPQDLDALPAAVETALKGYGSGRLALKKQYAPVNWTWLDSAAPVFHH
ncbi:hypothetical protein [Kitasatospora sp. NPDC001683]